jgi:hypothetical protein
MTRNAIARASSLKPRLGLRANSPYTVQNVDAAIAHLERVLCDSSLAIFGAAYWRARIQQVESTPGLMHMQLLRLRFLIQRLPDARGDTSNRAQILS